MKDDATKPETPAPKPTSATERKPPSPVAADEGRDLEMCGPVLRGHRSAAASEGMTRQIL